MGGRRREPGYGFYREQRPYEPLLLLWFLGLLVVPFWLAPDLVDRLPGLTPGQRIGLGAVLWVASTVLLVDAFRRHGIRVNQWGIAECRFLGPRVRARWSEVRSASFAHVDWVGDQVHIDTRRGRIIATQRLDHWLRLLALVQAEIGLTPASPKVPGVEEAQPARPSGLLWEGPYRPIPPALTTEVELTDDYNMDGCFVEFLALPIALLMAVAPPFQGWALLVDRWQALRPGSLRADGDGLTAQRGRWRWSCRWEDMRHLEPAALGWRLSTAQGDLRWHRVQGEEPLIEAIRAKCDQHHDQPLPRPVEMLESRWLSRAAAPQALAAKGLSPAGAARR